MEACLHVNESRQNRAQPHRSHLGSILGCEGLEHPPWNTAEHLSDHQRLHVGREEKDEDEAYHGHKSTDHRLAITVSFANESIDDQANDFASSRAVRSTLISSCS
jgi:hypothetical protein